MCCMLNWIDLRYGNALSVYIVSIRNKMVSLKCSCFLSELTKAQGKEEFVSHWSWIVHLNNVAYSFQRNIFLIITQITGHWFYIEILFRKKLCQIKCMCVFHYLVV